MAKCENCNVDLIKNEKGKPKRFCCKTCKGKYYREYGRKLLNSEEIDEIQRLYDTGLSLSQISKISKYSKMLLWSLSSAKVIKIRNRAEASRISSTGKKLSQESKDKISKARKKFLEENPDKVPYKLNHKYLKQSFPEKYFVDCFGGKFKPQYQFGSYTLDFADIENRLDIEIDGCQHHLDPKIVEHDIKRNQFLNENGWKVLRIRWSEFKKSQKDEQKEIVNTILQDRIPIHPAITFYPHDSSISDEAFQHIVYKKENKVCDKCGLVNNSKYSSFCENCIYQNRIKIKWPTVEEMTELVWKTPTTQIAKDMGISDNAITKFCRKNKIAKPGCGYWQKMITK
jgi:very-short-patch-repair endonuclease